MFGGGRERPDGQQQNWKAYLGNPQEFESLILRQWVYLRKYEMDDTCRTGRQDRPVSISVHDAYAKSSQRGEGV
jgi:hypothetical protein